MRLLMLLALSSALIAQEQPAVSNAQFETRAFGGDLRAQLKSQAPAWFGYQIKSLKNDGNCCWEDDNRGCTLEEHGHSASVHAKPANPIQLEGSHSAQVLFRLENNRVDKVRLFSMSCPLDAGGLKFVWLTGVPSRASLAFLREVATQPDTNGDGAIFAISQHDDPYADELLDGLADSGQPEKTREKVAFWLGSARGESGVKQLQKMLQSDPSEQVRDKVVFALSISKQPEGINTLIQAAKTDKSAHVRSQALFWLAQKAGKQASETIVNAVENDPDAGVKKKAVFALSQLPKDEGIPKLIEIAQTQRNPEVRKQAFFWLGQSGDPRALAFIEQVLAR